MTRARKGKRPTKNRVGRYKGRFKPTQPAVPQAGLGVAGAALKEADQVGAGEAAARNVLEAREKFPGSMLADLYDPLAMPAELVKAHAELDRAVDLCYRPQPFQSDRQCVEYLFGLYEKLTAPLLPAATGRRRKA